MIDDEARGSGRSDEKGIGERGKMVKSEKVSGNGGEE